MFKAITLLLAVFALFAGSFAVNEKCNVINSKAEASYYREVEALHILVPTEAEAIKIRSEIMQGETKKEVFDNFREAAKKYSKCPSGKNGGILGRFGRGDMVKPFETAAFELTPGTVSEPVKTQFGWHLIYVISKK